jgi:hypothetical protein
VTQIENVTEFMRSFGDGPLFEHLLSILFRPCHRVEPGDGKDGYMVGARRFAEHEVEFRRVEIHGRDAEKYLIPASRSLGEQIEEWRRKILPTLARVGVRWRGQFFADLRPQAEAILDRRSNGVEQMAADLFERVNRYL